MHPITSTASPEPGSTYPPVPLSPPRCGDVPLVWRLNPSAPPSLLGALVGSIR